ncbi:MAG: hypothetical protein ACJ0BK_07775 [Coraliomargaritaceae bacterium]
MKLFPKPDPIPFALILLTLLTTVLIRAKVDTEVLVVPACLIGFVFYIAHLRVKKRTEAMCVSSRITRDEIRSKEM